MFTGDGDAKVSSIVDDLFYTHPVPSCNNNNMVLYQILDQAPQGRKLMNYMIHLRPRSNDNNYNKNPTRKQSLVISQRWRKEEKRVNPKMSPATLQLETPVIFSWSKKAHDIKMDQIVKSPNDLITREPQESTNNRLYQTVNTHLNHIKFIEGSHSDDSSTRKTEWTNSGFKVDPLQPFVARPIKEPKKKALKKEKTSSKMKNLFGFLSNTGKKEKSQLDQRSSNINEQKMEHLTDTKRKEEEAIQEQEQEKIERGGTVQEQVSLSSKLASKSTETNNASSPLSMDSFIPLQPKKRQ